MPLRLQVISVHRESMGGSYMQEFAACGGTIGRSLECDWPLPDSKRYVSSRHAMIDYQGGAYYLVDNFLLMLANEVLYIVYLNINYREF